MKSSSLNKDKISTMDNNGNNLDKKQKNKFSFFKEKISNKVQIFLKVRNF